MIIKLPTNVRGVPHAASSYRLRDCYRNWSTWGYHDALDIDGPSVGKPIEPIPCLRSDVAYFKCV
jgi:hypothetical protein